MLQLITTPQTSKPTKVSAQWSITKRLQGAEAKNSLLLLMTILQMRKLAKVSAQWSMIKRPLSTGATQNKVRFDRRDRGPTNNMLAPDTGPSAQVKPTRTLPNRPGRNIHPAGVRKVRRSKEQVDADRKAGLKALEEKMHEVRMAKELLARMNVLEEHEENDLPALYPQRLSAHKRLHADVDSDSDECFDIRVDDEGSDSDTSSKSDNATKLKTKVRVPCRPSSAYRS